MSTPEPLPPADFEPCHCSTETTASLDTIKEDVHSSTEEDLFSWEDCTESDSQKGVEEINDQTEEDLEEKRPSDKERLQTIEEKVEELFCDKEITAQLWNDDHTQAQEEQRISDKERLQAMEAKIEELFAEKEITTQLWNALREPTLQLWSGKRPTSKVDRRLDLYHSRGNIRADIRAIEAMKSIDSIAFNDWTRAFADRYGVPWEECAEANCLSNLCWEGVQIFNMRAYISHRHQQHHDEMMRLCDSWITGWRKDHKFSVCPFLYFRLCRLYYQS